MQVPIIYLAILALLNLAVLLAGVIVLAARLRENSREHTELYEVAQQTDAVSYDRIRNLQNQHTALCGRADEAAARLDDLNVRVAALEQSVDDAIAKQKEDFDITGGIAGILSYDPYAAVRKGGEQHGE